MRHEGHEVIAGIDDAGRRLDRVLRAILPARSLSEIYAALRKGKILVNGAKAAPALRLEAGSSIYLDASLGKASISPESQGAFEDLGQIQDILVLATEHLIFINKPRGALAQGSSGLEVRIRVLLTGRSAASLSFRPGPLHRLDRNTTGIMAFPRSAEGARAFSALLRERRVIKRYLALVDGEISSASTWRDLLAREQDANRSYVSEAGADAHAEARPLLTGKERSLLLVELHSGLTHQIRAQAAARRQPLCGDSKYGGSLFPGGYILHSFSIGFPSPPFPDIPASIEAPLPEGARDRLEGLFGAKALSEALGRALK